MLNILSRNSSLYESPVEKFHPRHENEKIKHGAHSFSFFWRAWKERKVLNGWERLKPEKFTIAWNLQNIIKIHVQLAE